MAAFRMGNAMLRDIDEGIAFDEARAELGLPETRNFAVIFNAERASSTSNIPSNGISEYLRARQSNDSKEPCLWLNLWGWHVEHQQIIKLIARHYEISPRLMNVICPVQQNTGNAKVDNKDAQRGLARGMDETEGTSVSSYEMDTTPFHQKGRMPNSIADIADDLWHFNTVDYGRRYVCVCWNALFFFPDEGERTNGKPNAIRVWSALLLCDDGTVISTFENPEGLSPKAITAVRNNQINIFTHLSKHGAARRGRNMLMQIAIRPFHLPDMSNHSIHACDLASLLFYYLFDDWINIYYQVVGGENSYRNQLEKLRRKMIDSPDVSQVMTLHNIGRQLVVLKAVYRSYQTIIERIVKKHRFLAVQASNHHLSDTESRPMSSLHTGSIFDINDLSETNIRLATSAIVRFERLLDRISLCAITEVDECQKEKDDMVMMVSPTLYLT